MLIARQQPAGENHNRKIKNNSYKNVTYIKYYWIVVTDQYNIHKEIKSKVNAVSSHLFCPSTILKYKD